MIRSDFVKSVGIIQVKCYLKASQNAPLGFVIPILCHIFALIFGTNHIKIDFSPCGEEVIHIEVVKMRLFFMTYLYLQMEEHMPHLS